MTIDQGKEAFLLPGIEVNKTADGLPKRIFFFKKNNTIG